MREQNGICDGKTENRQKKKKEMGRKMRSERYTFVINVSTMQNIRVTVSSICALQ